MATPQTARSASSQGGFFDRLGGTRDIALALGMVAFILIMIIPLSPVIMDMLLAVSVSGALLILLGGAVGFARTRL